MSLITCPECHGQVSDKATACPHCGFPISAEQKKQKEVQTEQASSARARFAVDRIYSGRVYFQCQCGCTIEKPFSFINTIGTGTYQLRENLVCPRCGAREAAGKLLVKSKEKTPDSPRPDQERKEKQKQLVNVLAQELVKQENIALSSEPDKKSLLVPCQHCGKMTNRYKFLCENCGEKWSGTDYGKPDTSGDSPYTVRCRHCGQPTNKYKAVCENCGKPIVQPTTGAKKAPQDSGGHHVNGVLFVLVAAVVISLIIYAAKPKDNEAAKSGSGSSSPTYSSGSSYSGSSGTTSKKYDDDEIKATVYVLAKKCVKNHLKAPSTAEFSEMWECAFTKGEDNVYMMTGYVDSQNSYGAMLQEQWSIMAQVSGDKASLVMLTIGDQVYFD